MDAIRRYDRRLFLSCAGRAGLGVVIVGTTAACATDGAQEVSDAAPSTPQPATAAPAADSSAAPLSSEAPASAGASEPAVVAFDWRRVDLGFVSAYLLVKENQAVVVDTGVDGSAADIEQALTALGLGWYAVDHVIFTHDHPDHIGSSTAVLEAAPDAQAYAGEADILSITSPRPIMPVGDGDEVFGLQIVETPGHTPGHISVLDRAGGVLVAGDALVGAADGGQVAGPDAAFTADMAMAVSSVRKLAALEFDTVLFGHGNPVEEGAGEQVDALAERLSG
ncbi:MAG: MBL fold metallo-hydrolase [Actinobacteria bacterium]|nr:MBL fold metallo-hydrolase [Actinomycetota bacterium]